MPTLQKKDYKGLDEVGGRAKPVGGFYHVAVHNWDEKMEKKDQVVAEFQVLAGTTPGQEGKVLADFIGMKKNDGSDDSENFDARLRKILVSGGVIALNDAIDRDVTNEITGKQMVIEVEERPYKGSDGKDKTFTGIANFGRNIWPIGDPAVAHVPLHAGALALRGQSAAPVQQAAAPSAAPAPVSPAMAAGHAAAPADAWSQV